MMDDSTKITVSFKNNVSGEAKLEKLSKQLKQIYAVLNGIDKGKLEALSDIEGNIKVIDKTMKDTAKNAGSLNKTLDFAIGIGSIKLLTTKLYQLSRNITKLINQSSAYVENLNLLEVAYSNINKETGEFNESIESSSRRIETFISKMSEVYGLDESRLTRSFGIFKQLANAMELPTETAENLSEIMVKMTNDVASLYNLDLERASNALQSALVGQVRPIRGATGADITEKTLQKTVDALGMERSISDLSFVEKRLVMVISLTEQLKKSQGDYGRTIESVANQLRIMHEQWDRLARAVGNVFYPILEKVLPYLNAVLMTLTEIFNIMATLLGFKLPKFDYSGLAAGSEYADDIIEGMDGAGASVDKLKDKLNGLRGFDKLNVINTPKDSGSSAGIGTVDPKIMDAFNARFKEYNDMLDQVHMKATQIRDKIMEWLGFTKQINPFTGQIVWKYEGFSKTLKNIWEWFKKLSATGKLLAGIFVQIVAASTIKNFSKLLTLLGDKTGIGKAFKSLISYSKDMIKYTKQYGDGAVAYWREQNIIVRDTNGQIDTYATRMNQVKGALDSLGTAVIGLATVDASIKDINTNGTTLFNTLTLLGGELTTITSTAKLASTLGFGAVGTAVGALIGSLSTLGVAIVEHINSMNNTITTADRLRQSFKDTADSITGELDNSFALMDANALLLTSLEEVVDENGKVKKGYEDRAEIILGKLNDAFGTEYKLIDGQITKNGEQVISYNEVKQSVEELIKKKKEELTLKAFEDLYLETLKNRVEIQDRINRRQEITNKHMEWYQNALKGVGDTGGWSLKELENGLINDQKELKELTRLQDENSADLQKYSDIFKASAEGNTDRLNELTKEYGITVSGVDEDIAKTTEEAKIKTQELEDEITRITSRDYKLQVKLDTYEAENQMNALRNKFSGSINVGISYDGNPYKADGGIFANGKWHNITAYAGGGLPPVGQMFVARENGPELVGKIGSHTAVMNNDQIVGSVADGVYNAVRSAVKGQSQGTQVYNIYLDESHKIGTYTLEQLQGMAKSNGRPITIGG